MMRLKTSHIALVMLAALSACTAIHPPDPYLPSRSGIEAGETITVKNNENIYTVAREHNVSMRELIVLNDLKPPFAIKPGQSLTLPATGADFAGGMKAPDPAPVEVVEKNPLSPIEPAAVSSSSLAPVAAAPAAVQSSPQAAAAPQALLAPKPAGVVTALNAPAAAPKPLATTAAPPIAPAAAVAAADGAPEMKWPVQGPILSSFGSKSEGVSNDGVNIGAPKGAPVVASAPGTVVYAGDDMKGFGNLVLIRHQGDWVTAYAHLDRVLVKKDSIVAQGDMIGTVGKTGDAATPQLHFETRQGGKAVDPEGIVQGSL